ncbi:protein phosphatase 2C domain-containing protein [Affinibrenneria salicis]|uniref:Protein phosphatase 2C domain-containing protein n=1 Tax=Affinibrenneria salicis TaxID=2590031 RepID=A0A5J5G667_9GAMM|nr:PP2C family serine/threonine-protein phosphatase [Affinibrenneria salicis]KAA9002790.1 protein phosphatase 2C domain-containing protein [Affinibrenneria salicis]KAA9002923.1 protein phosphatase 2C domain-containing protein [Affinibrenneria salicis]
MTQHTPFIRSLLIPILAQRKITLTESMLATLSADKDIQRLIDDLTHKVLEKAQPATNDTPPAAEYQRAVIPPLPPLAAPQPAPLSPADIALAQITADSRPRAGEENTDAPAADAETNEQTERDDAQEPQAGTPLDAAPAASPADAESPESQPAAAPLKPGQVPRQTGAARPPATTPPPIKINLANARVGAPYRATLDIPPDDGAAVVSVDMPQDIGLAFDAETRQLTGTPTKSGDYELEISWTSRERTPQTARTLLIINPDPRSLWKVIEPPADDKYFKPNIDRRMISAGEVNMAAASRRGRSHEHVGAFRDDDFFIAHDAQNGWSIMIVADGAGSAKNSRQGSRIAVQTAGEFLSKRMSEENDDKLLDLIQRWDADSHQALGLYFSRLYHNAARLAVNTINNEAIKVGEPVKSFSTTLLATVSLRLGEEWFAASFWMGDGAIAAYGPAGKVRLLGAPDSGEYAGQTRFLDNDAMNDPAFNKRIIIGKWRDVSHLILMTDGVSDPWFETDNGLQSGEKWRELVSELSPALQDEQAAERLTEWLSFFSAGNHDDRTIAVCW